MQESRGKRVARVVMMWVLLGLASGCGGGDGDGGGGGGGGDDRGQTATTATVVNPNSQTAGVLSSAQDVDVFQITLSSRGTLTIRTTGATDTAGGLFRSLAGCPTTGSFEVLGQECINNLIEDGDDEEGDNFRIVAPNLSAGTYFIAVGGFRAGGYTLVSSFTPDSGGGDDHGQTATTATVVNPNSQTAGVLSSAADADVFQVTVPSRGTLTVRTTGTTDTIGRLLRSLTGCATTGSILDGPVCGDPIADGDDEDGQNFRIVATNLAAGTYFVVVEAFDQPGSYTLVSSFTPTP